MTLVFLGLQMLTVSFLRLNDCVAYEAPVRVRRNGSFDLLVLAFLCLKLVKMSLPLLPQFFFVPHHSLILFFRQKYGLSQRNSLAVRRKLRHHDSLLEGCLMGRRRVEGESNFVKGVIELVQ